jgi:hypothetical protein
MSTSYNPQIVTDGLILNLDPANKRSYAGSGNIVNDLSNTNLSGTLSSVSYSTNNLGSFVYDGTSSIIASSENFLLNGPFTMSVWVKHNSVTNKIDRYLTISPEIAVLRHDGETGNAGRLHLYFKTNSTLRMLYASSAVSNNVWQNFVGTWNGTVAKLYKNSVELSSLNESNSLTGGSNLQYYVGLSGTECLNGNIGNTQVYNRALTADEINQNFNALRGRYGI